MSNADTICKSLKSLGYKVFGGQHAPYVWLRTPDGIDSWSFFDKLLSVANVVCTPGADSARLAKDMSGSALSISPTVSKRQWTESLNYKFRLIRLEVGPGNMDVQKCLTTWRISAWAAISEIAQTVS
jgi:hypothetical protein